MINCGIKIIKKVHKRNISTHEVFNQSKPFQNVNLFRSDPALQDSLKLFGIDQSVTKQLDSFGEKCGSKEMMDHSDLAEKNKPSLRQFDNYGRRIDIADYHPSYHVLMKHATNHGCSALGFKQNTKGSHVARAALIYMENQLEPGHCCPIVMTCAAIPVLQRANLGGELLNKIMAQNYDPRDLPVEQKTGATVGMSMTEKQGGSDVRANTTVAVPVDANKVGPGSSYHLTGHKWFTSAPMSDAFLTLAKTKEHDAPSCFIVPRWLPDGSRNSGFQVMRLKDKLADKANASSEVEYSNAWGQMIGEPGKGVRTIIEMVQSTRLDCTLGSAGGARRALQLALNHANTRSAFGKPLIQQPLMQNLLTDLCVEAEAHTLTAMHMAAAFDKYYSDPSCSEEDRDLFRIGVSVSKYYVTKRLPLFTYECLEAIGGNGFVEDFQLAKLFRQSPLNSVWEGSGNVMALDIVRGYKALPALFKDIKSVTGADKSFDLYVANLEQSLSAFAKDPASAHSQRSARNLADRLAVAMQGSIMIRNGDPKTAAAYIASRIQSNDFRGVNPGGVHIFSEADCEHILQRNMPVFSN